VGNVIIEPQYKTILNIDDDIVSKKTREDNYDVGYEIVDERILVDVNGNKIFELPENCEFLYHNYNRSIGFQNGAAPVKIENSLSLRREIFTALKNAFIEVIDGIF